MDDPANLCEIIVELFIFRIRARCKEPSCKPPVFGMTNAIRIASGMTSMRQGSLKTLLIVEEDR